MRQCVTALALVVVLAATPAQAQNFGIFFGDEPGDLFSAPPLPMCMTDRQIRDAIANEGFDNIALNAPNEDHIQVRATRNSAVYLIDFNFCTGQIEGVRRLR